MDIRSDQLLLLCKLIITCLYDTGTDGNVEAVLPMELRTRLDQSALAREQIVQIRGLNIDFYPRESHLITFRDPWSFPTLFHPACNQLVRKHMEDLARKVLNPSKANFFGHNCVNN